ncbi:MAG TPA: hypothetical protein V6C65_04350 [Allocoleopsis sp.]
MNVLSYTDKGKKIRIRSRKRSTGSRPRKLTRAQRIRLSQALRRWARMNRGVVKQRGSRFRGKHLSVAHRRKISRSLRRSR